MEIKEGDLIKININKVKKYDSIKPYIQLVKKIIRNAKGKPYVSKVSNDKVSIRSWKFDMLGDVTIPKNAIIKVVGNDYNYQLRSHPNG